MTINFTKAKREKIWAKVLLTGPSGSGKTFTALRLATGFAAKCGTRIAAIDTENGRIRYYAGDGTNGFDFDDLQLEAPYTSQKYIDAIQAAIDAGYKMVIIDSLSHEWLWCNEIVNSMPGNSFQNWGKVKTQHHNKFAEFLIQSPVHIIATARGKDKWVMEDKNGRQAPKKVGEGSVASDDTEYNYTLTFNLAVDTHIAACSKDNTHLFEGRYDVLTEKDGAAIYDWANSGEAMPATVKTTVTVAPENGLESLIKTLSDTFKAKMEAGVDKDTLYGIVEKVHGSKNFMSIKSEEKAKNIIDLINEVK